MSQETPDISSFLQSLEPGDDDDFLSHNERLVHMLEAGMVPHEIVPLLVQTMQTLINELSTQDTNVLRGEERFLLSQLTHAIEDILETGIRGYQTAAREHEGVYAMDVEAATPIPMGDLQREYTVIMQDYMWKFIKSHPEYEASGQVLLDWIHTIQASDQSSHGAFTDYQQAKAEFYSRFENMNKTAPTTDSLVDVARAATIIRNTFPTRESHVDPPRILFAGSGNMDRFEGPLLRLLKNEGIYFGRVAAIDRVNYADHIRDSHEDLSVEFRRGDVLDPHVFEGEQFDIVFFPWSVLCDILPRRDLIKALHRASKQIKPGGILITDQAVPIGESSYKHVEEEQATRTGEKGVFSRSFAGPEGEELWSTFNIMEVTTLLRDAAQAGFISLNMPTTAQKQQEMVNHIEGHEAELVHQAETKKNYNAMSCPIYQANGWNRMTVVLQFVGKEEALKQAHTIPSLFHALSSLAVGKTQ